MRFLAAEKLSEHKYKTAEGYLVCVDAVLSRTGKQKYIRSELFGDSCKNPTDEVEVDRLESDVFDEKAMASFENKPICIEHPDEDVNVANHNDLSVGFVRDIKRGTDNGQPVMLGTLVITDENAIDLVESGEYAELSCGYDCDIVDDEHPTQRNIRGNHVALCKQGRAGIARIIDSVDDMAKLSAEESATLKAMIEGGAGASLYNRLSFDRPVTIHLSQEEKELLRWHRDENQYLTNEEKILLKKLVGDRKVKDSEYHQIDMTDPWGGTRSLIVKAFSFEEAKKKAEKFKPEWKFRAGYQASKDDVDSAKRRGLYVDSVNDDLYGLIKEPVKRYYLAKKYDKKWDIEENIVIIAKNISEAEQKLKRRFPDAYNLHEISHSEYLKFRHGNVIIDNVNDDALVSADKLKVGMRVNYRGRVYTVEAITPNKLYSGEVDLTLKADNGSRRVLETGVFDRFTVVDNTSESKGDNMKDAIEKNFEIYVKNAFGAYKVADWSAVSKEAAVKEFLAANPSYRNKGIIEAKDSTDSKRDGMKDVDYEQWTKQGWRVVALYKDGGRIHAIVERKSGDFVVALGYNTSTGEWAQGRYVSTFGAAVDTLNEEKPGAVPIRDAKSTKKMFEISFVKDGVTYVRKVKANDLQDAIKLAQKDAYKLVGEGIVTKVGGSRYSHEFEVKVDGKTYRATQNNIASVGAASVGDKVKLYVDGNTYVIYA